MSNFSGNWVWTCVRHKCTLLNSRDLKLKGLPHTSFGSTASQTAFSWASVSEHLIQMTLRKSLGIWTNSLTNWPSENPCSFRWCSRKCQTKSLRYIFANVHSAHSKSNSLWFNRNFKHHYTVTNCKLIRLNSMSLCKEMGGRTKSDCFMREGMETFWAKDQIILATGMWVVGGRGTSILGWTYL